MTKNEAVRMLEAMKLSTIQQSAALMGMRAEVEPGSTAIGLGAELRFDGESAAAQAKIEDAITAARDYAETLEHVLVELTTPRGDNRGHASSETS